MTTQEKGKRILVAQVESACQRLGYKVDFVRDRKYGHQVFRRVIKDDAGRI